MELIVKLAMETTSSYQQMFGLVWEWRFGRLEKTLEDEFVIPRREVMTHGHDVIDDNNEGE